MLAEAFGVGTGWLFGRYHYAQNLGIKILDVPVIIGFAWIWVIAVTREAAAALAPGSALPCCLRRCLLGALLATALDLVIDPVATRVLAYWSWHDGGFYYGIPAHNFLGWFVVALLMHLLLELLLPVSRRPTWAWRIAAVKAIVLLLFLFIAAVHGLWLPVLLALLFHAPASLVYLQRRRLSAPCSPHSPQNPTAAGGMPG